MVHNILYVDDEASLRNMVKTYLETLMPDVKVTAVSSAQAFLEELADKGYSAVREGGYSLGLVDIEILGGSPDMDGFRVFEEVRRTSGISDIPLILYSGNQIKVDEANSRGFDSVLKTDLAGLVREISRKLL
ncbi:response regulator [Candidatus Woesearchaeota archaeon]|nr:response regulator [Candidatus Woesearchaeota archaeon]